MDWTVFLDALPIGEVAAGVIAVGIAAVATFASKYLGKKAGAVAGEVFGAAAERAADYALEQLGVKPGDELTSAQKAKGELIAADYLARNSAETVKAVGGNKPGAMSDRLRVEMTRAERRRARAARNAEG